MNILPPAKDCTHEELRAYVAYLAGFVAGLGEQVRRDRERLTKLEEREARRGKLKEPKR